MFCSPQQQFEHDKQVHGFIPDAAQNQAIQYLEDLFQQIVTQQDQKERVWARFSWRKKPQPKGLYFWGGVGRGKTYLMDVFFNALPVKKKLRTHFHRFMREVHAELKSLPQQKDPLVIVAKRLASRYQVICFDEFFVADITDAMILANLLSSLLGEGVIFVATSNIAPDGLYKNGLQRSRFLPAIALLKTHTIVVNVDGGVDYRLRTLEQQRLFYSPADEMSEAALLKCYTALITDESNQHHSESITIESRKIPVKRVADSVVWFDFYAVCDGPRSQHDYIEIAREFHTVLISNVPIFKEGADDLARRFIYLVDEFYDRHVKLILSAQAAMSQLYESGRLAFEFERAQSRLIEMQSREYLARQHKA